MLLLTLPIMLPMFEALELDLIWLGVLVVKYLEIGMLTPPVGFNVYIIKSVVGNEHSARDDLQRCRLVPGLRGRDHGPSDRLPRDLVVAAEPDVRCTMAVHFNEREVPPQTYGHGARRQPLLTADRIPGTNILLDRVTLLSAGGMRLEVGAADIAWFQVLDGDADLSGDVASARLSDGHVVFCPPGFGGTLTSKHGASLLLATVPQAARFDAGIAASPPPFRIVDWRREPVLNSQHDARKRIYLVTPMLFGHKVIKGEMIIYPAGHESRQPSPRGRGAFHVFPARQGHSMGQRAALCRAGR